MSQKRLSELLSTGCMFFTQLTKFDDEFEGTLTSRTREQLADWFQNQNRSSRLLAYEQVDEYESHQNHFYANCWHMSHYESYLMWKAYGQEKGVAIRTSFERLRACCDSFAGTITGGLVKYIDYERDTTDVGNDFQHAVTKSVQFSDEREFRLLVWGLDPKNQMIKKYEKGTLVPVDVSMLVDSVIFGPSIKQIDPELKALIERNSLKSERSVLKVRW